MYEHLFRKLRITVALEKANMAQYGSTHWLFGVESLSTGNYGNTHHTLTEKVNDSQTDIFHLAIQKVCPQVIRVRQSL